MKLGKGISRKVAKTDANGMVDIKMPDENRKVLVLATLGGSNAISAFYGRSSGLVEGRYLANVVGAFRAVTEEHLPVTVVEDWQLTPAFLDRHAVVVLPNTACLDDGSIADQSFGSDPLVYLHGAQNTLFFALREDDALLLHLHLARSRVDRLHQRARVVDELLQLQAVRVHVLDWTRGHARLGGGFGHGRGNLDDQARIERLRNQVFRTERQVLNAIGRRHDVALFLARQFRQGQGPARRGVGGFQAGKHQQLVDDTGGPVAARQRRLQGPAALIVGLGARQTCQSRS